MMNRPQSAPGTQSGFLLSFYVLRTGLKKRAFNNFLRKRCQEPFFWVEIFGKIGDENGS
jgi:hypothetical protein